MTTPFAPLSDDEFDELDQFLLYDVDTEEGMTIDTMDGFLHAIAIGPTTVSPNQWLPKIWGTKEMMPPMESLEQLNHILGLVMRHHNGILAGLEANPSEITPCWSMMTYEGQTLDNGEGWAHGFVTGMRLCWEDWLPLLSTPEGQAWYRPIALLGEDDYCAEQDELTRTPAQRAAITLQIPDSVLNMHVYWLPFRQALHEREVGNASRSRVGRNEPCPCGSGKKFKKCCGANDLLH